MTGPRKTTAARQAEALGESVSVTFDGATYDIPPSDSWDIGVLEAAEAGQLTRSLRLILGEGQYLAFREKHTTVKVLKDFYIHVSAAVGTGNS